MDQRSVKKRPRSSTPTLGESSAPPKKKSKSNKKSKTKKKSQMADAGDTTSTAKQKTTLHETATANGQIMSEMLSTFRTIEQSRFSAYKRSTLNHGALQDWVAACLVSKLSRAENPKAKKLGDLVTPGSESEIGMVVSTAAKIYAQRLVTAAVKISHQQQDASSLEVSAHSTNSEPDVKQLQPEHIWKAFQERTRNGVDPGLYLQKSESAIHFNTPNSQKYYDQRRLAALAAQDEYDKKFGVAGDLNEAGDNGTVAQKEATEQENAAAVAAGNELDDDAFMDEADEDDD